MKLKLKALLIISMLLGCTPEAGEDGVNGLNGLDGVSIGMFTQSTSDLCTLLNFFVDSAAFEAR